MHFLEMGGGCLNQELIGDVGPKDSDNSRAHQPQKNMELNWSHLPAITENHGKAWINYMKDFAKFTGGYPGAKYGDLSVT